MAQILTSPSVPRPLFRIREATWSQVPQDQVSHEAPLQICLAGDPFVTTMRTPGDDHVLALGFLYAEGQITSLSDISRLIHCGELSDPSYGNVLDALPGPGFHFRATPRAAISTTACGVCGRTGIEDLLARIPVLEPAQFSPWPPQQVMGLLDRLRHEQVLFHQTGSVHGALILDENAQTLALFEDVGRHNAIDKSIGHCLSNAQLSLACTLVTSGRASFEVLQKAAVGGIGLVVTAKGPTSLAIDLAEKAGITLCGFVRNGSINVYTHPARLERDT